MKAAVGTVTCADNVRVRDDADDERTREALGHSHGQRRTSTLLDSNYGGLPTATPRILINIALIVKQVEHKILLAKCNSMA